nr:unnamed protein product [Digitaria exilis]
MKSTTRSISFSAASVPGRWRWKTCTSPGVSSNSASPLHPLASNAAWYALPFDARKSSPATATSTRAVGIIASDGAAADVGDSLGSSTRASGFPVTNLHSLRMRSSSLGPMVFDASQKYGCISITPRIAAGWPSAAARMATLCAMLAPALSPAKNTRVGSPCWASHGSGADPPGAEETQAAATAHKSAAHESS